MTAGQAIRIERGGVYREMGDGSRVSLSAEEVKRLAAESPYVEAVAGLGGVKVVEVGEQRQRHAARLVARLGVLPDAKGAGERIAYRGPSGQQYDLLDILHALVDLIDNVETRVDAATQRAEQAQERAKDAAKLADQARTAVAPPPAGRVGLGFGDDRTVGVTKAPKTKERVAALEGDVAQLRGALGKALRRLDSHDKAISDYALTSKGIPLDNHSYVIAEDAPAAEDTPDSLPGVYSGTHDARNPQEMAEAKRRHELRREALADYAHEAWAGWMRYLFEKSIDNLDGTVTIPSWAVERWRRQIRTPYAALPAAEQESDRAEADKMIAVVERRR